MPGKNEKKLTEGEKKYGISFDKYDRMLKEQNSGKGKNRKKHSGH